MGVFAKKKPGDGDQGGGNARVTTGEDKRMSRPRLSGTLSMSA